MEKEVAQQRAKDRKGYWPNRPNRANKANKANGPNKANIQEKKKVRF